MANQNPADEMHYFCMDSRLFQTCSDFPVELDSVDEDWERFILEMDTDPNEVCRSANNQSYSPNCVVADETHIRWDWYDPTTKRWKYVAPKN